MAKKRKFQMVVDIVMIAMLPFLMAYQLIGEAAHEWLGICFYVCPYWDALEYDFGDYEPYGMEKRKICMARGRFKNSSNSTLLLWHICFC